MSHRTEDLPARSGVAHAIRELRYHEGSRQALAFVLIAWFALAAATTRWAFFAGGGVVLLGTAVRLYASGYILKNHALATTGPYGFVRHPLYTGNILIIFGFSLCSGVWWTAVVALFFFWFYYPTAIEYEDRKLRKLFGKEWENWASSVPALLPRRIAWPAAAGGAWSLTKSYKQNGEPIIVAYILFWLAYIAWPLS
jgi:hypothetical protein